MEAGKVLIDNACTPETSKDHNLAIRVDVENGQCIVAQQRTSPQFRFRGFLNSVKGSIRPSIAHCLIRISKPFNYEIFYDPFCGAGTIVLERGFYPSKKLFASDISAEVLKVSKSNLDNDIILFQSDATCTKLKRESIDTVVTNPPWGK
ncbi:hypothetical protein SDC9_182540 [bioreactor metagenome]|uniref:Ribosomal RNA large subunit methyltransferase K/L-like methyltransferase domain-containing protein n=1 Tax=bioreactor metagenome TaxID=1076179 RepID=A0A645H964_9ZZZZ